MPVTSAVFVIFQKPVNSCGCPRRAGPDGGAWVPAVKVAGTRHAPAASRKPFLPVAGRWLQAELLVARCLSGGWLAAQPEEEWFAAVAGTRRAASFLARPRTACRG